MKIRYFSDLHVEFQRGFCDVWTPPVMEHDADTVLVLAGDIDVGLKAIEYINTFADRFKAVIYVAGNHDLWKQNLITFYTRAQDLATDNVYVLQNTAVTIDDTEFLGTTLWTDINRRDPFDTWNAPKVMRADFKKIRDGGSGLANKPFRPVTWLAENMAARRFLETTLDPDKKQVVVTHHAPDFLCAEGNECSGNNGDVYYYNRDMEQLIADADLWIFGHTHHVFDQEVYGTRIVSNPGGYAGVEPCQMFSPESYIEI